MSGLCSCQTRCVFIARSTKPQTSLERQTLPGVLDVLERRAQLVERAFARERQKFSREENKAFDEEYSAAKERLGGELAMLYISGDARKRLMIEVYTTLTQRAPFQYTALNRPSFLHRFHWRADLPPEKIRMFISDVGSMNEDELREELRKAQEEQEKKIQAQRKGQETRLLNEKLTLEERAVKQREDRRNYRKDNKEHINEQRRRRYRVNKERGLYPPRKRHPKQVFPEPTQE
jgi:hypothetical protein